MNELKKLLYSYLYIIIHPFGAHEYFSHVRSSSDKMDEQGFRPHSLLYVESISISWIFHIIAGIYAFISIMWAMSFWTDLRVSTQYLDWVSLKAYWPSQLITIVSVLFGILFYPFLSWIKLIFWEWFICFFSAIFGLNHDTKRAAKEIMSSTLSADAFLIIPIMGSFLRQIAASFFMYAGLRKNLNMTLLQSLVVLLGPLIFMFFMILLMILYFFLLLNLV